MPEHPVFTYLSAKINASGMSRKDIVIRMGYKNITKGLRRLDNVLDGGREDEQFLTKLSQVLAFPVEEYVKIKEELFRIKREYVRRKAKANFRPHLFAFTTHKIPSPIFVGAMVQHWRFVDLEDDFLKLEYINQLARVSGHITAHMLKNEGGIPAFGWIKYYILNRTFEEAKTDRLFFDTKGSLIDNPEPQDKSEPGTGTLAIKGRSILPIMRLEMDSEGETA